MSGVSSLALVAFLTIGLVGGGIYFAAMWWSAQLFATGGRAPLAFALVIGRLALALAGLALIAIHGGAWPLLATALGILIARMIAVRRIKAMAP